jgi:hypothetical protein
MENFFGKLFFPTLASQEEPRNLYFSPEKISGILNLRINQVFFLNDKNDNHKK